MIYITLRRPSRGRAVVEGTVGSFYDEDGNLICTITGNGNKLLIETDELALEVRDDSTNILMAALVQGKDA